MKKRKPRVVVLSDIHLGARECQADALLAYLSSIRPEVLVLNGDLFDFDRFDKAYFPPSHFKVLKKILGLAAGGTLVYYLTGNRDQGFRKFTGSALGNLQVLDRLLLTLDGRKTWFFHGDVCDLAGGSTKWIARLGSPGYRGLLFGNKAVNRLRRLAGREPYSAARKTIKGRAAREYLEKFEQTVVEMALNKRYDTVVCGHIHHPKKAWKETPQGNCLYLNSGDWTDNLTALEYAFKRWKLYRYSEDKLAPFYADEELKGMDMNQLIASIIGISTHQKDEKAPDGSDY
ncbi:UDP-2,3-diacylglucosamine diphosphatase [Robiginitalea sp. SC105]|uniref:UDP-2,3-diacylglucosamine diphosphatase n=1 Tax=Robiginitalea sp. SC105 TaxID=2762332 RepID=UPI00163ABAA5|nr:UDP-2,3-diacylglucosamine diphosphatase [Robiginitalea sp. SC105]MBC2840499.1 UDP-2,3-diacylglucosamine diphosphatase [Robiginitalea sp. SC105]